VLYPLAHISKKIHHKYVSGKDVIRRLKDQGWTLDRVKGSHHVMRKAGISCPIPIHGNKDLAIGTLKSIERITGVKLK
jgi:predicted RNA binding protein YcfA (HicA-like mRNA interferase family)